MKNRAAGIVLNEGDVIPLKPEPINALLNEKGDKLIVLGDSDKGRLIGLFYNLNVPMYDQHRSQIDAWIESHGDIFLIPGLWTIEVIQEMESRSIPPWNDSLEVEQERRTNNDRRLYDNWHFNQKILSEFEFNSPRDKFIFELYANGYSYRETEYWLRLTTFEAVTHQYCAKLVEKIIEKFRWEQSWRGVDANERVLVKRTQDAIAESHKQLGLEVGEIDKKAFNLVLSHLDAETSFDLCVGWIKHLIKYGNFDEECEIRNEYFNKNRNSVE